MDATMDQLRSFVHQRLFIAAEEIFGEVAKTITLALYEAEASRSKEEEESLRHQLDLLRKKSAAEASLTISTVEHGDICEAPLLQENQGPSTTEETNLSVSAEVPGLSQTSTYPDSTNWDCRLVQTDFRMSVIKEEQEELWDYSLGTQMFSFSPRTGGREDDQPETEISFEMQPVSDCSPAQSELDGSDEEWVHEKEKQDKKKNRKGKILQGQRGSTNEKNKAALPHDVSSAKSEKSRSFCQVCGKGFQYIGSLLKHIKAHETNFDCSVCEMKCKSTKELITHVKNSHAKTYFCGVCGMTFKSTKELITHVKDSHNKTYCCDVCGKTFSNSHCLRLHERIHSGKKDFKCQECSKTFYRSDHLTVHLRTHSGEKPYHCDICGKAFSQRQNLTIHKRSHSGENTCERV